MRESLKYNDIVPAAVVVKANTPIWIHITHSQKAAQNRLRGSPGLILVFVRSQIWRNRIVCTLFSSSAIRSPEESGIGLGGCPTRSSLYWPLYFNVQSYGLWILIFIPYHLSWLWVDLISVQFSGWGKYFVQIWLRPPTSYLNASLSLAFPMPLATSRLKSTESAVLPFNLLQTT